MRTSKWMTGWTLALGLVASALAQGPYGVHAARLAAQARLPQATHGFSGLGAEEFPAFGTEVAGGAPELAAHDVAPPG